MQAAKKTAPLFAPRPVLRTAPRSLTRLADPTKKYPKFFLPHEVKAIDDSGGWEVVSPDDKDITLVANDLGHPAPRSQQPSGYRIIAAEKAEDDEPFDLARLPAAIPDAIRVSGRPTMPLGPSAVMVLSEPFADITPLVLPRIFSAPPQKAVVVHAPPRAQAQNAPGPLLATVVHGKRKTFGMKVAAAATFLALGAGAFGAAHRVHHDLRAALPNGVNVASNMHAVPPTPVEAPPMDVAAALAAAPPSTGTSPEAAPPALKRPAKKPLETIARAKLALAGGDLATASILFDEIADAPATHLDGMTGLAEIARSRGDMRGAQARYREILTSAPQYFPARLGVADTMWELGDKDGARAQYLAIEKSYPAKMISARALERAR